MLGSSACAKKIATKYLESTSQGLNFLFRMIEGNTKKHVYVTVRVVSVCACLGVGCSKLLPLQPNTVAEREGKCRRPTMGRRHTAGWCSHSWLVAEGPKHTVSLSIGPAEKEHTEHPPFPEGFFCVCF